MPPFWTSPLDSLKWLLFELGAGYYARKLASGPEADLRQEFLEFFLEGAAAGPPGKTRVLDVGCGPGHLARSLARRGCEVTAVDRGWRLLRIARRWARREGIAVTFRRAPAESLPFGDGAFDCACATTLIYLVADPARVLAEMVRVTRNGGTVATLDPHASMSVPAMRAYAASQGLASRDARKLVAWAAAAEFNRRFEEAELRRLLLGAGLDALTFERRLGGMVWFARGRVAKKS